MVERHKPEVRRVRYEDLSDQSLRTMARTGDNGARRELDKREGKSSRDMSWPPPPVL